MGVKNELLRLYIREMVDTIVAEDAEGDEPELEESSGCGGIVGVAGSAPGGGPGWVEPKGFATKSSKRRISTKK